MRLSWTSRLAMLGLCLVTLGLRLWQLAEPSLWHDESLELERALASLPALLAGRPIDQDPPLAALCWRAWILAGGGPGALVATSEWWLRLPSALLGTLTVCLAGAWAGRRFGSRMGWLTGLVMAFSPVQVHYAQALNQYAALPLLALLLLVAWERVLDRGGARDWRRLGLFSVLALLTHYGMAFPIAATVLHLGWRAWRRRAPVDRRRLGRHLGLLGLCTATLLALGLANRVATPHLDQRLFGTGLVKELDYLADTIWRELLVFFALPFAGGPATWIAGALALLALLGATGLWARPARSGSGDGSRPGRRILEVGLLGSLLLVYPADILGLYPLGYRWALFASPVYLLCIAAALDGLWRADPALGRVATGLVLLNLLLFLPQQDDWNPWLALPREAMRPAVTALSESLQPGDLIYVSDGAWPAFAHYARRRDQAAPQLGVASRPVLFSDVRALRGRHPDRFDPSLERDRILASGGADGRVWLLVARAGAEQAELEAALLAAGFEIERHADLPGVSLRVARPR